MKIDLIENIRCMKISGDIDNDYGRMSKETIEALEEAISIINTIQERTPDPILESICDKFLIKHGVKNENNT